MSIGLDLKSKIKTYAFCGTMATAGLLVGTLAQKPKEVSRGFDDAGQASVVVTPSLGQIATMAGTVIASSVATLAFMGLGKIKQEEREEAAAMVENVSTKKVELMKDESKIPFSVSDGTEIKAVNMAALKNYMAKSNS